MEEEKREEKVEKLKDDFDDIKEMQKTQELKKINLEKEEKKEEKNKEVKDRKTHPNYVAFLIAVLMILFTLMGYCCGVVSTKYMKHNNEKEKDVVDQQEKEEKSVELSDQEKEEIKKIVYDLGLYFAEYYEKGISSISNQDLLYFALKTIGFKETISKEEIESVIYKYFGDYVKVSHEAIKCFVSNHEPLYLYEDGMYKQNNNHGGHGGGNGGSMSYPGFVSGEVKGNTITVKYKIAYYNACGDTCATYALYDTPTNQKNPLYESKDANGNILPFTCDEKIFDTIKDKLPVTTFVFDREYHLKQVNVQ